MCNKGGPDIETSMTFSMTSEMGLDNDNWKKSLHMMSNLKVTQEVVLILEADDLRLM